MIDWFTVIAQAVNFLVLVVLLKHFLYGPIVNAMDEREKSLKKRWQKAEEKEQQADQQISEYKKKTADIEDRKQQMLEEARKAADQERHERMKKAREEADALSDEWRSSVEHEKESFLHNIKESLAHQAVLISQKSLHDLADASLEQQMTKMFIGKLAEIEDDEKSAMKQAIHENEKRAAVKTSFDLPEEERGRIKKEFQERLGIEASIDFEKTGDILAGIELTAGGRKIGWTIAEYIEDASEAIAQALGQERGEQPSSGDHNQEQGQGPEQKRQKDEGESTEEGTDRDA